MWIGAVSLLFLIFALTTLIDNDQGTHHINRPVFFAVVCLLILFFIYGVQKIAQSVAIRQIRIHLDDLQNDALEGSHRLWETRRKYLVVSLIIFIILTLLFILGLIKAMTS